MAAELEETVPASPDKSPSKKTKTGSTKKGKNQPGRYSQLVVDTIRKLGERNGSSLAKVFNEAKKVPWFDQQNGRTYLRYSIKALVQNDTLLQVKGTGASGSFKLNRKKLEGQSKKSAAAVGKVKKAAPSAATLKKSHKKKPAAGAAAPKKSHKKAKSSGTTPKKSPKKTKPSGATPKKSHKAKPSSTPKKSHKKAGGSSPAAKKVKKAAKPKRA